MTDYFTVKNFLSFVMTHLGEMGLDPAITWDFVDGVAQITCSLPPAVLAGHLDELVAEAQARPNKITKTAAQLREEADRLKEGS